LTADREAVAARTRRLSPRTGRSDLGVRQLRPAARSRWPVSPSAPWRPTVAPPTRTTGTCTPCFGSSAC